MHGRECNRRNSYLLGFMFYKNILFVMVEFWFGFISAFSAQSTYEQWIYQLYNLLFTSIPIMWFALFDFQYKKEGLVKEPKYYKAG